ncbi:MAG TPA: ferrous iron transport protein A [Leptolyngbyaceae cyanobacterium M65_K2018_010]|nr:ferrous iron transport protein A [Leptolyngbyaceae cyanobacterium M65_K2018_010]
MFNGFTVSGASLQVLNVGDCGTIARFPRADPLTLSHLQALGLDRGKQITVTQRHPYFRVSTEDGQLTLPPSLVQMIYVRLVNREV